LQGMGTGYWTKEKDRKYNCKDVPNMRLRNCPTTLPEGMYVSPQLIHRVTFLIYK
jgi:hypothetical protein